MAHEENTSEYNDKDQNNDDDEVDFFIKSTILFK